MKIYSTTIILLVFLWGGCKEKENGYNALELLERVQNNLETKKNYPDIYKNLEMAISEYKNDKMDPAPIIISAIISGPYGEKPNHLSVFYYDEDKDALGIGIEERYFNSDGKDTIITEEYPVLFFCKDSIITPSISMPIKTRDYDQRKSDQNWNDYMKTSKGIRKMYLKDWQNTLPDVWISIPDPNKVEVEMYIYDKKGNKSNSTIVHRSEWIEY